MRFFSPHPRIAVVVGFPLSSLQIFYISTSCFALFLASKGRVNFGHLSSLSNSSPKLLSLPFILCMQPNRNRHQERLREGGKGASKQHSASLLLWLLHDFDPSLPSLATLSGRMRLYCFPLGEHVTISDLPHPSLVMVSPSISSLHIWNWLYICTCN